MKIKFYIWLMVCVLSVNSVTRAEVISEDFSGIVELHHNCRIWASISREMPDSVIYKHLISFPNSIEHLSEEYNIDGWGIAYYEDFGDSAVIERGAVRAHNDPYFDTVVERIESLKPNISLAHVRRCSAGCCDHGGDSILDPHPFYRFKNDKQWTFIHNGTIDKALLYDLIGEQYLIDNPPNGSDIIECDPTDTSMIIDSELYFLYLLKTIEESDWDITEGITRALIDLQLISYDEAMNFVLSDGSGLWAFRRDRTLYYLHEPETGFSAVASMHPTEEQDRWQIVGDSELLVLRDSGDPIIIDLAAYLPSISGIVTDEESYPVDATNVFIPRTDFSVKTGPNGVFHLKRLSLGQFDVRFTHPFYADTTISEIEIPPDNIHVNQDVIIRYPGSIAGVITNPRFEPIESVYVSIRGSFISDLTDANGEYLLDSLNLGSYELAFRHPYYSDTTINEIRSYSDSTTILDVMMGFPGYITGTVINEQMQPVENMHVYVRWTPIDDITDTNGVFVFDSLNSGTYDLTFYHINYGDTIIDDMPASPGDTTILNIVMPFLGYAYYPGDMNMYNGYWPPRRIGSDVTYLVNFFSGLTTHTPCLIDGLWASADVNGDCIVNGGDITRLVAYFNGQNDVTICPDFPAQWPNPTDLPPFPPFGWPPCEQ
ncbi:MAG: hypothetical protein GY839_21755 [candidate division Zixibacteria bacterium]|nr:hypothetical protein [candidate division Zixibacteria bacterium]